MKKGKQTKDSGVKFPESLLLIYRFKQEEAIIKKIKSIDDSSKQYLN